MYLGQHPGTGGTTFDPPTNVMVDDETGTITWLPPTVTVIEDNFDSYTPGDFIAEVGEDWTTWTGSPGSAEDAHVSDAQSYSPSNSILVEEGNDLILIMDDYTEGKVAVDLMMYVPTGYCGYYNLQQTSTPGQYWGFQIYFQTDGTVIGDAGEAGALNFTFNHDEWMSCKVIVDLDNDLATYYHDGVEMISWQWSLGTFGNPQVNQLGGVNIFGGANTGTTDVPMFYVDDVMVGEVPADLTGFKLYLDSSEVTTVGADVGEYTYEGLDEDQTYLAGISALYDPDESEVVEVEFTYNPDTSFDPPTNPAADVSDYNDVVLTWEAPSGAAEWLRWDSGENFDAIGLTAGGTFLVAAKWDPADLTEYDGAQITKLEFFPNEVVTEYIAYVWEGANAGTMLTSEVVTTYNAAEFTEVVFSSPATIDASQELWIGYEVTHAAGAYPAGCDAGPAIAGYGDLISQDGGVTWDPLSGFGLDYNWNLAAYIESADGEPVVLSNPQKPLAKPVSRVLNQSNPFSCIQTTNLRETRSLSGYKIYQDGVEIDEVMDPATLTYTVGSLDAGTYSFTITAVYTAPEGESVETDPVSAEIVLNPPSNVDAQSQPPNIIITWGPPARGVDSYNIYRNGELHAENVTGVMFIDVNVPTGTYTYNLTTVYDGGWESAFSPNEIVEHVTGDDILKPTVTELTGNYPNPFNPETTISFSLKEAGHVTINIYNLRGQLVKTLVNTELDNAYYEYVWDGKDNSGKSTSSGVYFYKMKAKNYNSTKKMILMK
ncbi:MAG: T9SS type A sorting domain-containing protein [Candidatus Cloacimonetes bacterium]|nr:T9SS type A sorting domain-containing protein [Candidatus Cloacimonadota bacterium]